MLKLGNAVAILLAIALAFLPVAMPRAGGADVHPTHASADHHLDGHDHQGIASDCDAQVATVDGDVPHQGSPHDLLGSTCCNMSCHFVQVSAAPALTIYPRRYEALLLTPDAQVGSASIPTIRRPPKAV